MFTISHKKVKKPFVVLRGGGGGGGTSKIRQQPPLCGHPRVRTAIERSHAGHKLAYHEHHLANRYFILKQNATGAVAINV